MNALRHHLNRFVREEDGATMVEYGLMVALIAVVCIAAVTLVGTVAQRALRPGQHQRQQRRAAEPAGQRGRIVFRPRLHSTTNRGGYRSETLLRRIGTDSCERRKGPRWSNTGSWSP